jgi:hypothetical protein
MHARWTHSLRCDTRQLIIGQIDERSFSLLLFRFFAPPFGFEQNGDHDVMRYSTITQPELHHASVDIR